MLERGRIRRTLTADRKSTETRVRRSRPADTPRLVDEILTLPEKIRQRRSQLVVHSYLYYRTDVQLVTDQQWDSWSKELERLQAEYNKPIGFYDKAFADWTHGSGLKLPVDDWVRGKASQLVAYGKKQTKPARVRRIR